MSIVMETLSTVEDQVVDAVTAVQEPVAEYVRRAAEYVASVLPEDLPEIPYADQLPSATELIEFQFAFAQRVLEVNHKFATALIDAAAPVLRETPKAKPAAAKKAA
jgi:hypothetical protein